MCRPSPSTSHSFSSWPYMIMDMLLLQDLRKQLYSEGDDSNLCACVEQLLKALEQRLAEGAAALQHLKLALVNVACDDPGAAVGMQLALPLLQVVSSRLVSILPSNKGPASRFRSNPAATAGTQAYLALRRTRVPAAEPAAWSYTTGASAQRLRGLPSPAVVACGFSCQSCKWRMPSHALTAAGGVIGRIG